MGKSEDKCLTIGVSSCLKEYMTMREYKRSRSVFDLDLWLL